VLQANARTSITIALSITARSFSPNFSPGSAAIQAENRRKPGKIQFFFKKIPEKFGGFKKKALTLHF